jgi:hypothetical protein
LKRTLGIALASAALGVAGATLALAPAFAQAPPEDLTAIPPVPTDYQPGKTAWGEPDFRGGWPIDNLNGRTPLQRDPKMGNRVFLTPEEFAEKQKAVTALNQRYANEDAKNQIGIGHWAETGDASRRTSYIIDPPNGRLPAYTDQGKQLSGAMRSTWRRNQTFDWVTDFDSWDRCITRGLPASMFPFMYNNGMRIFQSPGLVALQMEMIHDTRMFYTDGRKPVPRQIRQWMGESRAHWENGNTLVVETTNFHPGPSATNISTTGAPPENDTPVSAEAHMTERFTMTGPDSMAYVMTWNDPVVFTAPWTARLDWKRDQKYEIFEYACHEGNAQVRNYVTASRAQRAKQAQQAIK